MERMEKDLFYKGSGKEFVSETEKAQTKAYEIEQAKRKKKIEADMRQAAKENVPDFGLQEEAFQHIDRENEEGKNIEEDEKLVCWSYEDFHRRRKFLAARRKDFWDYYKLFKTMPERRNHYEIIRENEPCHLYFDLEFNVPANPNVDGVESTSALLDLTREELFEKHNVLIELDKHVVELESKSNESNVKFSRHVILRLPGAAFKSNIHVGKFVKDLWNSVCERRSIDNRCEKLFVRKAEFEDIAEGSIIDLGVYTKNRAFRLFLSSKANKKEILTNTNRFWTSTEEAQDQKNKEIFFQSLVTKIDSEQRKNLIEYADVTLSQKNTSSGNIITGYAYRRDNNGGNNNKQLPCTEVVDFVLKDFDNWSGSEKRSEVRSWAAFPASDTLILHMVGNRFCENIKRQHKSNNVMLIIDFQRGVYHQRCHDPDCKGMEPQSRNLPDDVLKRNGRILPFELQGEDPKCESDEDEFWKSVVETTQQTESVLPKCESDSDEFWESIVKTKTKHMA